MKNWSLLASLFFFMVTASSTAVAQNLLVEQEPIFAPVPRSTIRSERLMVPIDETGGQFPNKIDPEPDRVLLSKAFAKKIEELFLAEKNRLLNKPKDCGSLESAHYARALLNMGQWQDCASFVLSCKQDSPLQTDSQVYLYGAQCEASSFQWQSALELFSYSVQSIQQGGKLTHVENSTLYAYGLFLLTSEYDQQFSDRIDQHTKHLDPDEVQLLKGAIEYTIAGSSKRISKEDVIKFLIKAISLNQDEAREFFVSVLIRVYQTNYQYDDSRDLLRNQLATFKNPLNVWPSAFRVLYSDKSRNFKVAALPYAAFIPYAHSRSWLPTEQNTSNYTELYTNKCKVSLTQGNLNTEFLKKRKLWQEGNLSAKVFETWIDDQLKLNPLLSDLLTTKATLLSISGDRDKARTYYWMAHQSCPNYNRSHWGLVTLNRIEKYRTLSAYQANIDQMEKTVSQIQFGNQIDQYFLNFRTLTDQALKPIKYGARIFAPWINLLNSHARHTYIKSPFELLSESPGLENIRDERIGGENYPNDNRLWDDVRGLGGDTVIADLEESIQPHQGAYNLLGHEISHQFHHYLKDSSHPAKACITKLYQNAHARGVFPDGYAAQNENEYFAQGITYFLVPENAPFHFGINRSWLPANDPDLFNLIQVIDSAQGDLAKIICPK